MDIGIDFFSYSNSSDSNYTRILIIETYILGAGCITISFHKRHKNHMNSSSSNQRTSPVTKPGPFLAFN